jgi:hypothetical protein
MNERDHEKLDVSVALADEVVERLPRGRAYLADQLQRAATSIALTIADGVEELPTSDTARFSRNAKALGTRIRRHRARLRPSHGWPIPLAITPAASTAASRGDACPDGPANRGSDTGTGTGTK